jgi:hypothetical protein
MMRTITERGITALPWPARGALAGAAGTAAMTLTYAAERRIRHGRRQLDYDDSLVPGEIVRTVMHLPAVSDRQTAELGLALRWGYGSAFGCWHSILRRRLPEPWASVAFAATLMSATLTLFPVLGRTPPPWKWAPDVLATSFGTHAVYVLAVAAVDHVLSTSAARIRRPRHQRCRGSVRSAPLDAAPPRDLA